MRLAILHGFCLLAALAVPGEAFAAGTLYGSTVIGEIFTIDTATGAGTLVGAPILPCGTGITEIEFNNLSRRAFAQCPNIAFAGVEIDLGTATPIGPSIPNGATFTGLEAVGGTWYGTAILTSGGPSALRRIDPFTGTSVLIGPTGVGPMSGIAFDKRNGILYGVNGGPVAASNLHTIDLATGAATVVGSLGIRVGSLRFGPDGRLYAGRDNGDLYVVDPRSGAATRIGATGFPEAISGLALVEPTCGDPGNPFQNCGLETGDFTGWVTQDLSSPFVPLHVGVAGETPGFGFFTSRPTEGTRAALHGFDGNGPGHIRVAQDVTLPGGGLLEFDYRAAWNLIDFCTGCLDRTFDVVVEPAGGGTPLASTRILTASAGTTVLDTGDQLGFVNLGAFAGQTVRVAFDWFVPQVSTGPAFFQLDNVRVTAPSGYFTTTPCRLVDTRSGAPLGAGSTTSFTITGGACHLPAGAKAAMLNVTVVGQTDMGDLRVYPTGQPEPLASTINFRAGATRANNATIPVGTAGQVSVKVDMPTGSTGTTHLVLDLYGYYQ